MYTPNFDRLVKRGASFVNAYSSCPVCIPARYTIRTGCQAPTTGVYKNMAPAPTPDQPQGMEERCGAYLPRTLQRLGYRTFGVGKFHTQPRFEELGYETHLHSEELYGTPEDRARDAYASFIAREYPEYDWIEGLMGERTEMYYMPQMSLMPAEITVEAWAADRTVELLQAEDPRPFFGMTSLIGPHPPCAPPLPFNRMYDPDRMPGPVCGARDIDHMDEQIPWMNHLIWAEDINAPWARTLRARYYGEISYIDQCLGRILDAVEERDDADNTLMCFFSDHGDHLGDHHGWQKESYFEAACNVPFLVSWPARLRPGERREELVGLVDLFGIATTAAGAPELREGMDVLGLLEGRSAARERFIGYYGMPGTREFKMMVREGRWKYIFLANGGREQLFDLEDDPNELKLANNANPEALARLREAAQEAAGRPGANRALDEGCLRTFPFETRPLRRIYQFDRSRGITGFPELPGDALK